MKLSISAAAAKSKFYNITIIDSDLLLKLNESLTLNTIDGLTAVLNNVEDHLSISELRDRMIKYNLLLDSYRNTSFFEVFPMYKKY